MQLNFEDLRKEIGLLDDAYKKYSTIKRDYTILECKYKNSLSALKNARKLINEYQSTFVTKTQHESLAIEKDTLQKEFNSLKTDYADYVNKYEIRYQQACQEFTTEITSLKAQVENNQLPTLSQKWNKSQIKGASTKKESLKKSVENEIMKQRDALIHEVDCWKTKFLQIEEEYFKLKNKNEVDLEDILELENAPELEDTPELEDAPILEDAPEFDVPELEDAPILEDAPKFEDPSEFVEVPQLESPEIQVNNIPDVKDVPNIIELDEQMFQDALKLTLHPMLLSPIPSPVYNPPIDSCLYVDKCIQTDISVLQNYHKICAQAQTEFEDWTDVHSPIKNTHQSQCTQTEQNSATMNDNYIYFPVNGMLKLSNDMFFINNYGVAEQKFRHPGKIPQMNHNFYKKPADKIETSARTLRNRQVMSKFSLDDPYLDYSDNELELNEPLSVDSGYPRTDTESEACSFISNYEMETLEHYNSTDNIHENFSTNHNQNIFEINKKQLKQDPKFNKRQVTKEPKYKRNSNSIVNIQKKFSVNHNQNILKVHKKQSRNEPKYKTNSNSIVNIQENFPTNHQSLLKIDKDQPIEEFECKISNLVVPTQENVSTNISNINEKPSTKEPTHNTHTTDYIQGNFATNQSIPKIIKEQSMEEFKCEISNSTISIQENVSANITNINEKQSTNEPKGNAHTTGNIQDNFAKYHQNILKTDTEQLMDEFECKISNSTLSIEENVLTNISNINEKESTNEPKYDVHSTDKIQENFATNHYQNIPEITKKQLMEEFECKISNSTISNQENFATNTSSVNEKQLTDSIQENFATNHYNNIFEITKEQPMEKFECKIANSTISVHENFSTNISNINEKPSTNEPKHNAHATDNIQEKIPTNHQCTLQVDEELRVEEFECKISNSTMIMQENVSKNISKINKTWSMEEPKHKTNSNLTNDIQDNFPRNQNILEIDKVQPIEIPKYKKKSKKRKMPHASMPLPTSNVVKKFKNQHDIDDNLVLGFKSNGVVVYNQGREDDLFRILCRSCKGRSVWYDKWANMDTQPAPHTNFNRMKDVISIYPVENSSISSYSSNVTNVTILEDNSQKSSQIEKIHFESPKSPEPTSQNMRRHVPKTIPLEKVNKLTTAKAKILLDEMLQFADDNERIIRVAGEFLEETPEFIAELVLEYLIVDTVDTPLQRQCLKEPLLTITQKGLFKFMIAIEQLGVRNMQNVFLKSCDLFLPMLTDPSLVSPIARLYVAVCKSTSNYWQIRKSLCNAFVSMEDLAIPYLYVVLQSWLNVLPLYDTSAHDKLLTKALLQIILRKTCNTPGYNLSNLRMLISKYYKYSLEIEDCKPLLVELFKCFIEERNECARSLSIALAQSVDKKQVFKVIDLHVKPLISENKDMRELCAVINIIALITKLFSKKIHPNVLKENVLWLERLCEEPYPELIRNYATTSLEWVKKTVPCV